MSEIYLIQFSSLIGHFSLVYQLHANQSDAELNWFVTYFSLLDEHVDNIVCIVPKTFFVWISIFIQIHILIVTSNISVFLLTEATQEAINLEKPCTSWFSYVNFYVRARICFLSINVWQHVCIIRTNESKAILWAKRNFLFLMVCNKVWQRRGWCV